MVEAMEYFLLLFKENNAEEQGELAIRHGRVERMCSRAGLPAAHTRNS
jgi:hypothetical protein